MNRSISSLNLPKHVIYELKKRGYNYCKDISDITKIPVNITAQNWQKLIASPEVKTGLDILAEECIINGYIPTLIEPLDKILNRGIKSGVITEFTGQSGSGKTQICFHLCINVQFPKWCRGVGGEALYISTNKNFARQRLDEIAAKAVNNYNELKIKETIQHYDNFNVDNLLKHVHYIKAENCIELLTIVKYLNNWLSEYNSIRIIIIDSISAPLKKIDVSERLKIIYRLLTDLQILAITYNFSIILTNDMTTGFGSNGVCHLPSLGDGYFHRLNTRIELSKEMPNLFTAKIIKSTTQAVTEVYFKL